MIHVGRFAYSPSANIFSVSSRPALLRATSTRPIRLSALTPRDFFSSFSLFAKDLQRQSYSPWTIRWDEGGSNETDGCQTTMSISDETSSPRLNEPIISKFTSDQLLT